MRSCVGIAVCLAMFCVATAPAHAAKPRISLADVTVNEGAGTAQVPVSLSKKAKKKITFTFATADHEAMAGSDYVGASGSGKIAPRKRNATISVPLAGDPNDEYEEVLKVELLSAKRAKLGNKSADVTIADDDAPPSLSVTTVAVPEGQGSLHELEVAVSEVSFKLIEFSWSYTAGSATAGDDFQPTVGTLPVGPGERTHRFPVFLNDDALDEFDETFAVALSNVKEATASESSHTVAIIDDDAPPTVVLATSDIPESTSGTLLSPVSVQLSGPSAKPIEVAYATAGSTATSPADFAAASGQLEFDPGDTTAGFNLTTVGDYADEPDETVGVGFFDPVNVSLPDVPQLLTLTDDDPPCGSASSPGENTLPSLNGDTGNEQVQTSGQIFPCVDTDWHRFTLVENNSSQVDLHAQVVLTSDANDSPSAGDLDLCVEQSGVSVTRTCSILGPGVTEEIDICINDPLGGTDQATTFDVEINGIGNAVNDYTLVISGNTVPSAATTLNLGC